MKELSIEEKARAYDKAIEIINDYYQKIRYSSLSCTSNDIEVLERAFPQLKENEDERIKRCISDVVRKYGREFTTGTVTKEKMLAWLEKQGERKPVDKVEPKFKVGDWIIKKQNSDINKFGKYKITDIKDGKYWYNEFIICEITEQDEWELVI